MTMRPIIIALIGIVFFSVTSCNSGATQLKDIDSIMESDPYAALIALDKLSDEELSASDYAYYCLLYTQAQIKNGIIVSSDSLIRFPYKMYGTQGSGDLKRRTFFYNAKIAYNQGDLRAAMKDAIVAYEISKSENRPYWIARTGELIGDIFFNVYNYDQSELFTSEAAANYKKAGRELNHRYSLCDLATTYLNEDKDTDAMNILDSLNNIVIKEEPLDSALSEYIMTARYSALIKNNRFNEIPDSAIFYLKPAGIDEEIDFSIMKSLVLNHSGKTGASADILLKASNLEISDKQHIRILYALYRHALNNKDYQQAATMTDSLLLLQSAIAREILKESVTGVQRDFYSSIAEHHEKKSEQLFYTLAAVILVAVTITSLLVLTYRFKIRATKAELEANITALRFLEEQTGYINSENIRLHEELNDSSTTIEDLQHRLENKQHDDVQNKSVIEHLFREKWNTLNMLCNEYFEIRESEATRNAILNKIEQELKRLSTKKSLKEIEIAVNQYMGNIMSLLREECNFLKEDDFIFLSLVFAGLSVRAVCMFTGMKYKLYYLKKSRLSKRISSSDALHKELFLGRMG